MTQKTKTRKKESEEITIIVRHLQQAVLPYFKADAMYAGGTKVISVHSKTTEILGMGKICKIHKVQTIL